MFFAFTSCDNKEGDAEEEVVDYPFLGTWRRVSVENRGCSNDAINGLKVMNCPNDSECVELTFNEDGTYVSYYVQDGATFPGRFTFFESTNRLKLEGSDKGGFQGQVTFDLTLDNDELILEDVLVSSNCRRTQIYRKM